LIADINYINHKVVITKLNLFIKSIIAIMLGDIYTKKKQL